MPKWLNIWECAISIGSSWIRAIALTHCIGLQSAAVSAGKTRSLGVVTGRNNTLFKFDFIVSPKGRVESDDICRTPEISLILLPLTCASDLASLGANQCIPLNLFDQIEPGSKSPRSETTKLIGNSPIYSPL